jgi:hypothetical protein
MFCQKQIYNFLFIALQDMGKDKAMPATDSGDP